MNQILKRPKSTQPNHRSFFIQKKSTISTRQTSRQLAKSFIIKPNHVKSTQKSKNLQIMSQSVPIEIYFNSQYRSKYLKKVIDSFFVNMNPEHTQNKIQPDSNILSLENSNKISLRNRMKEWKKKSLIIQQFSSRNANKFIRSTPHKSMMSDISHQKQLVNLTSQKSNLQLESFDSINPFNKQLQNQKDSINSGSSFFHSKKQQKNFSKLRPLTQQNKRKKITKQKEADTMPVNSVNQNFTVSLFFNQTNSPRDKMRKQVRKLIQENQFYQEYAVLQDKKIRYTVRKYLKINENNPLFERQIRIRKRGVKSLWEQSKFQGTLKYPLNKSIRQILKEQFTYGQDNDCHIEIYPQAYYYKLFENKNQELIDIIRCMTQLIIKNKGKILISGGFNLANLHRIDEKLFYLKDLGTSAILQEIKIRDRNIKHLYQPVWKEDGAQGKWLVKPQSLAPQCLFSYQNLQFGWIENQPQSVMVAQIWSLGYMILELLTLIPEDSKIRCKVKFNQQQLRKGHLSISQKQINLQQTRRKQKYLSSILRKKIEKELSHVGLQPKILQLLRKMLVYDKKDRIKPEQILNILK